MPGEPWTPPELPSAPGEKRPDGAPPPLLAIIPPTGSIGGSRKEPATTVRGVPIVLDELETWRLPAFTHTFKRGEAIKLAFELPCFFCKRDLRGEKGRLVNPHLTDAGERAWSIACETCPTKGAPPA